MHWIARHILKELAMADSRTYSQLLPDGVEGNLFQYHARQLEKDGYIIRSADGYQLSDSGKQLVGNMSLTRAMRHNDQPQPGVMIYATNEAGQLLLFRWRRQPYRGLVSLPFGRAIAGRGVEDMAAEQLKLKTGFTANLSYLGQVSLITTRNHRIISVFRAANLTGQLSSDGLTGEPMWGTWLDIARTEKMPAQTDILEWILDDNRPPLLELTYDEASPTA